MTVTPVRQHELIDQIALDRLPLEHLPLDHLAALSDGRGLFEHAEHSVPRREHGYCLDDVARGLVVAVRAADRSPVATGLVATYLRFIERAVVADGRAHNRMDQFGAWTDRPDVGDWWGRAVLGCGFAASSSNDPAVRARAAAVFERAARQRSPHVRAMVSATIGAADLLAAHPGSVVAASLVEDGVATIPEAQHVGWLWPEPRLRYGNAAFAEALLAAGHATDRPALTRRGLSALSFLVDTETRDGHLSVTGVHGREHGQYGAQFDQQPIEVAAIADAAGRAYRLGRGDGWADTVRMAWAWFLGDNDGGIAMVDPGTGAGYDGLHAAGRNRNQGAESTLAAASTFQQLQSLTAIGTA